jgi:DNA helicase-2/ATP-dependent DNA helicase PcrA
VNTNVNPALQAAQEAEARVLQCLKDSKNFLLEAGAGAGKTTSLIESIKYLIGSKQAEWLRRNNQCVACITYTNAAKDVINGRIDGNPLVYTDTIHAFCWSIIKGFQPLLRRELANLSAWQERITEAGGIGSQPVEYDLGYRRIRDDLISLHHDDVLALTVALLPLERFQAILAEKYPFILVDEYQDTNSEIMNAIKAHLMGREGGPLIGLFGDHWQRIYDGTCGHVSHDALTEIGKKANFRSVTSIVNMLNHMRPELPQAVKDNSVVGTAVAYHTNSWAGQRRSGTGGGHWKDDLPEDIAHQYLEAFIQKLKEEGWNFSEDKTKILMLTHNALASEQGYSNLAKVYLPYTDLFIKKGDDYIAFFSEKLEPACDAYQRRRYGEMFEVLDDAMPKLSSHADKLRFSSAIDELVALRTTGTIEQLINYIQQNDCLRLPDAVQRREDEANQWQGEDGEEPPEKVRRARELKEIPYREMIALHQYIEEHTSFATKHSVKGDEFENVLVVLGRGWNKYNFGQYLEWVTSGTPTDKQDAFERNRNLLYVSCSRPQTRLALLFTQKLSDPALQTLQSWFGNNAVHDFAP